MTIDPRPLPKVSLRLLRNPKLDTDYLFFNDAASHPFDPKADGYHRLNGWWLAEAAFLAYFDETPAKSKFATAGLPDVEFFSTRPRKWRWFDTQGYAAAKRDFIIVTFRGTETRLADFLTNLRFLQVPARDIPGRVHQGFLLALESVWDQVAKALKDLRARACDAAPAVWFTGHSLGGALATLAAVRYKDAAGVYTVGAPRVGDDTFCEAFNKRFPTKSFVHINSTDLITHLPPRLLGYRNLTETCFIDGEGTLSQRPDIRGFVRACLSQSYRELRGGSLPVSFLADHAPSRYTTLTWNLFAKGP